VVAAGRPANLCNMTNHAARVRFRRVALGDDTAWDAIYDGCVIARVTRVRSLGRAYSKSQMGTRHIMAWQSSVADVPGLSDEERRAVQRGLRRRDKTTRQMTAPHILASYEEANVQLPATPTRRAA
jgi:hypothetical protein